MTTTGTRSRKKRGCLTRKSERARREAAKREAEAKRAAREAERAVPRKVRKVRAAFEIRAGADHLTCPYCGRKRASEGHVDRCRRKAIIPIMEARAAGIIITKYVQRDDTAEDDD